MPWGVRAILVKEKKNCGRLKQMVLRCSLGWPPLSQHQNEPEMGLGPIQIEPTAQPTASSASCTVSVRAFCTVQVAAFMTGLMRKRATIENAECVPILRAPKV